MPRKEKVDGAAKCIQCKQFHITVMNKLNEAKSIKIKHFLQSDPVNILEAIELTFDTCNEQILEIQQLE